MAKRPSTMTGLIDSLEQRGLVRRRPDPQDGRQRRLAATRAGRNLARRLIPEVHRFERDFMACLADDELARLLQMVVRLPSGLTQIAPAARLSMDG